jgi:YHS domain-containing protein
MKLSITLISVAAFAAVTVPALALQGYGKSSTSQEPAKEKAPAAAASDEATMRIQRPSYPLTACPISGKPLADAPVEIVSQGHLVRLCCDKCVLKVQADPAAAIQKIDEGVIAAQKASYPLKTSPVTDAKLDDKAVDYVYGTRLVRLESKDEIKAFEKDPKTAMAKVDKAYVEAQLPTYAMKKCPVSDEELGGMGAPVDYLYGTKLVRFCCKSCVKDFEKSPDKFVKKVAAAH